MKLFGRDISQDVAVIAEIGVNHEGDPDAAMKLLAAAAGAGADAVKFQTYTPERFASSADPARLERVKRFGLGEVTFRRLAKEAGNLGVAFFSTAVSEDVVPLLAELGEAIKVASGDLDFEPVMRAAIGTGKKVIVSTGAGTTNEVDNAVAWCRDAAGANHLTDRLVLMHCVASYPAPIEQANLASIPFLKQRYGLTTGWSHHCMGPDAAHAAVALGADLVEVHFTDRREGRAFRDHALSFEPAELKALIASVRAIRSAIGKPGKFVQPCEEAMIVPIRKGVVAARDLPAGHKLEHGDLMFARPASEFKSGEIGSVVGRVLASSVKHGELIRRDAVR